MRFEEFFTRATGKPPYGYQARLAAGGLPPVLAVPTGAGKTGIILAWLWRRLHGPDPVAVPRRLVYALPQRALVEQVADQAREWLGNLRVDVPLHVVMGGAGQTQGQWRLDLHRPAVVVGTVDSLVSKALNRGYGISRATYPVDFALVTNGAHWVVDEVQLCPESTTTLRQLAAFAGSFGTAEPFGLTCMSATLPEGLLDTVDHPAPRPDEVVQIAADDWSGELAVRLAATRTVRRLPAEPGAYDAVADAVRERHRPGTLTLVVANTVEAARSIYLALPDGPVRRTLLHSRFRAVERDRLVAGLRADPAGAGRIVVATQVVEAGLDLDAAVLVTEAAPWLSLVQRAGRCNRAGRTPDAELWWLPPARPEPYPPADLEAAAAELAGLAGVAVTGEELAGRPVSTTPPEVSVIRRTDLLTLFDTAPDLSGADLDVAPYVRDAEDLDVQLAWASWQPVDGSGRPPDAAKAPEPAWRCRVPLGRLRELLKRADVWRFDQALGQWAKVGGARPARPGEVLVMAARDGGYDPATGLVPGSRTAVTDCPALTEAPDPASGTEDAYQQDDASVAQRAWVPLERHSEQTRQQAAALLAFLAPALPEGTAEAVVRAAYGHDAGKCHDAWQRALCDLAPEREREQWYAERPWAKSAERGQLRYPRDRAGFRHELVSLLLLDGPLRGLVDGTAEPDLVRYLVLAHHGKLRIQVRGQDTAELDEKALLGLRAGELVGWPGLLGQPAGSVTVDLDQFAFGGDRSWTRTALRLRDRYGPFVLAYLETLVRIADWRASAQKELP
jgi:CRISPR-associated endonuclease/helicase Cas3